MKIPVKASNGGYEIVLERGALQNIDKYLSLDRRVLVVTDDGVPQIYSKTVADMCRSAQILTLPQGESSKNADNLFLILQKLAHSGFTRTDCIIAVGGGVVGDISGFAASIYMRGIDFYNIPTTVLSQVDSSVGGKTAIDFAGYKNIVGAFYPPRAVIIDPETLCTLPHRQISNGLAECVKMSLTSDRELFEFIENNEIEANIDRIIYRSLLIKKDVVEQDERESGLRRILNFGHTLGHAIEVNTELYHGECVAIGMMYMCSDPVRNRLKKVLDRLNLPTSMPCGAHELSDAILRDKKMSGEDITLVYVNEPGSFEIKTVSAEQFINEVSGK